RAHGENAFLDSGREQLFHGLLAHSQPLGLHQGTRVGGDFVELVLKRGHAFTSDLLSDYSISRPHGQIVRALARLNQVQTERRTGTIPAVQCSSVLRGDHRWIVSGCRHGCGRGSSSSVFWSCFFRLSHWPNGSWFPPS